MTHPNKELHARPRQEQSPHVVSFALQWIQGSSQRPSGGFHVDLSALSEHAIDARSLVFFKQTYGCAVFWRRNNMDVLPGFPLTPPPPKKKKKRKITNMGTLKKDKPILRTQERNESRASQSRSAQETLTDNSYPLHPIPTFFRVSCRPSTKKGGIYLEKPGFPKIP